MTLKQLEAFYKAALCDSFAIAARRLHISVSTLSKRISDLETSLGQVLFDRDPYRARLTSEGHALLPHVRQLLEQADRLWQFALDDTGLHGRFRFAVGELASLTWLPHFISQVAERHPQVLLEPSVDIGAAMEAGVESGELDFAVVSGVSARQRVLSIPMGEAAFDWVAAPALLHAVPTVAEAAARPLKLITMPPGAGTYRLLENWVRDNQVFWSASLTCNTWGGLSSLLIEGVGVGFIPRAWATPLIQRGQLCRLDAWPALPSLSYSMQMRRDDTRAGMARLKESLLETVDFGLPIPFLSLESTRTPE